MLFVWLTACVLDVAEETGDTAPTDTATAAECAGDDECFTVYTDCAQCEGTAMSAAEKAAWTPPDCTGYEGAVCDVDPAWRDACVDGQCERVYEP